MDSAELPFDVSTQYFSFSSLHIRFMLLTNTFFFCNKLFPMTLENDWSNNNNNKKDAKMNEKVYLSFDSCMCVICSHTLLLLHVLMTNMCLFPGQRQNLHPLEAVS